MFSISPEFQRSGIGKMVFASLENCIVQSGEIKEIRLQVFTKNEQALAFWVGCGFTSIVKSGRELCNSVDHQYLILSKLLHWS